jgi:hypothetical protein
LWNVPFFPAPDDLCFPDCHFTTRRLGVVARSLLLASCNRLYGHYIALSTAALLVALMLGRTPLPCLSGGELQMHSKLCCALNRQYVVPELKNVLTEFVGDIENRFPQRQTCILGANFPFLTGFPQLPHLSDDDGRKVDLAFYYAGNQGYLLGGTRSPVGYFAFEDGPTNSPESTLTLMWNLTWLQSLWFDHRPEPLRMKYALQWLSSDNRINKVFIEPYLLQRLGVSGEKIRFQGCHAARHDDHIHIQL